MKKSKELLHDPDRTIAEVAYDLGFNDPSYFSRQFRKEFGMTPSDFQTQIREA